MPVKRFKNATPVGYSHDSVIWEGYTAKGEFVRLETAELANGQAEMHVHFWTGEVEVWQMHVGAGRPVDRALIAAALDKPWPAWFSPRKGDLEFELRQNDPNLVSNDGTRAPIFARVASSSHVTEWNMDGSVRHRKEIEPETPKKSFAHKLLEDLFEELSNMTGEDVNDAVEQLTGPNGSKGLGMRLGGVTVLVADPEHFTSLLDSGVYALKPGVYGDHPAHVGLWETFLARASTKASPVAGAPVSAWDTRNAPDLKPATEPVGTPIDPSGEFEPNGRRYSITTRSNHPSKPNVQDFCDLKAASDWVGDEDFTDLWDLKPGAVNFLGPHASIIVQRVDGIPGYTPEEAFRALKPGQL